MSTRPDLAMDGDEFVDRGDGSFDDEVHGRAVSSSTPSLTYINETGLRDEYALRALDQAGSEIASQIEQWTQGIHAQSGAPSMDVFNRSRWKNTKHPMAVMSQCAWAVENDDILSTLVDVVEGLTFGGCRFELFDSDQQDVWNQWAADVDLDSRLREMFREEFKTSHLYVGLWWDVKEYTVRTKPPVKPEGESLGRGNRNRKKKFQMVVPSGFHIFDPLKIMPVGSLMFGKERFAYIATRDEEESFAGVMRGVFADPVVGRLVERKYEPTGADKAACADVGVDSSRLWLLREEAVFRHTRTRAQYERFAAVRLKSILPLLEMKDHLRASDRATLIGSTNFLVVITKGSDKMPAKQAEIDNLKEQSRIIARLPVLVGDHRLNVEIVSPPLDNTLIESRWQVLDSRLVFRALQTFMPIVQGGNSSSGVSEMSRVVSKGLENRRHQLCRALERHVFKAALELSEDLDESPSIAFSPKHITLDFKADVLNAILKLRDRGDISRETTLEEMEFDQDIEARRRQREIDEFDDVFQSSTPHSSPNANPYGPNGQPQQPGQQALPAGPGSGPRGNVGPNGQPRTEGGRPRGARTEKDRES